MASVKPAMYASLGVFLLIVLFFIYELEDVFLDKMNEEITWADISENGAISSQKI